MKNDSASVWVSERGSTKERDRKNERLWSCFSVISISYIVKIIIFAE